MYLNKLCHSFGEKTCKRSIIIRYSYRSNFSQTLQRDITKHRHIEELNNFMKHFR